MPSYYSGRSHGVQLPLTPPDSGSAYAFRSIHYPHDAYATQQPSGRHDGAYDYQSNMMQSAAAASSAFGYQQDNYSCNSLPPIQKSYYAPVGAPILPPLRINDRTVAEDFPRMQSQDQQNATAHRDAQRPTQKEDKPTGGVSAKLDYDMERMTDFVTQAAQSIFQQQAQSHPSFRKWVHQVLSATRLPSATILLSLHYLNDRLVKHPSSVQAGENQIYRLLAVALILGSKFLDDNTFINRSWSDVTAIKVAELNLLEMKWLGLIQYQLHIEPSCLQAWIESWHKFDDEYTAKHQATRLSPLNTNVHRHSRPADRFSPYPTPQSASSHMFDSSSRAMSYSTPFVTADLWSSSDRHNFYKSQQRFGEYDAHNDPISRYNYDPIAEAARRATDEHARHVAYAYPQSAHPSYYGGYANTWDHRAWSNTAHRYDCSCSTCAYSAQYRPYAMASSYNSAQSVMG